MTVATHVRAFPDAICFTVPGNPVPFARAGANGSRRFTPTKQANAMGVIAMRAEDAMGGRPPMEGALEMQVRATYAIPTSWPKKKQAEARWKSSKPDIDNIGKLCADSLNGIVFVDDAQISSLTVQKVYGPVAGLTISIQSLEGAA